MNDRVPLWLQAPGMQQLLHKLVDRLDGAELRGTRAQSLSLEARTWPALYDSPIESAKEALWEQLGELVRWGWLDIKPASALQRRSGYDQAIRVSVTDERAVRTAAGRAERHRSAAERWRRAVEQGLDASEDVKRQVGDYCIDIADRTMDEVVARLNELPALRDEVLLLREVSAQLFWGMSKVLDKRQGLVAALLGLDECPFAEAPVQLQVFLPPQGHRAVLFVENQMSFEQAMRSASGCFDGLALAYASGFKSSAQRLRTALGCSVFYAANGGLSQSLRDGFEGWLFGKGTKPACFWGDLDWAGMRILSAMRASFASMSAWQPGYSLMCDALERGEGHSPEAADKQGQKALALTGCLYADTRLLPTLAATGRFVDQELFRP